MLQAFIFDVDGTLADTEHAHLAAFNHAFPQTGMDWHWDEALYTELLNISGGKERMLHHWQTVQPGLKDIGGHGVTDTLDRLHTLKTAAYEAAVQDGAVYIRPGVLRLMDEATRAGIRLAIASTTSPVNVAGLLGKAIGTIAWPSSAATASAWRHSATTPSERSMGGRSKPPVTDSFAPGRIGVSARNAASTRSASAADGARTTTIGRASSGTTVGRVPPLMTPCVHRHAALQVVQRLDGDDLPRQLTHGADALGRIHTRVRRHACGGDHVLPDALAARLQRTARQRRLQHEHSVAGQRLALDHVARRAAAMDLAAATDAGYVLLAGRYEGIDERLIAREVDEEVAVGDFVVSGGELPALMLIDAIARQLPGALNDAQSAVEE